MSRPYQAVIASPLPGSLRIGIQLTDEAAVSSIDFLPAHTPLQAPAAAALAAVTALETYFEAPERVPAVALALGGTPFQARVWQALCAIAAGETRSYGELAGTLGSGPRAVAAACRRNPVPLLVPCHRVVAAHGWGGYMGRTDGLELAIKRWLIEHERHR